MPFYLSLSLCVSAKRLICQPNQASGHAKVRPKLNKTAVFAFSWALSSLINSGQKVSTFRIIDGPENRKIALIYQK